MVPWPLARSSPVRRWRLNDRRQAGTWMAAARGACVNGDHAAERCYRNTARLIMGLKPLTSMARCLVGKR